MHTDNYKIKRKTHKRTVNEIKGESWTGSYRITKKIVKTDKLTNSTNVSESSVQGSQVVCMLKKSKTFGDERI